MDHARISLFVRADRLEALSIKAGRDQLTVDGIKVEGFEAHRIRARIVAHRDGFFAIRHNDKTAATAKRIDQLSFARFSPCERLIFRD